MAEPPRTVGQALSNLDLITAGVLGASVLVVVGSIGPWVSTPLGSSSGLNGDGKWTVLLAVLGAVQLLRGHPAGATIACVLILATGIYDAIHIHSVVAKATFSGV
jgi:hypothetical protein